MKRVNDTEGYCITRYKIMSTPRVWPSPPLLINHLHLDFPPLPMCMYTNQVDWMFPSQPHPNFRLGLTLCMSKARSGLTKCTSIHAHICSKGGIRSHNQQGVKRPCSFASRIYLFALVSRVVAGGSNRPCPSILPPTCMLWCLYVEEVQLQLSG